MHKVKASEKIKGNETYNTEQLEHISLVNNVSKGGDLKSATAVYDANVRNIDIKRSNNINILVSDKLYDKG